MGRKKEFQVRRKAHRQREEMKERRTEREEVKEMWHVAEEGPRGGAVGPVADESVSGENACAFVDTPYFSLSFSY